MPVEMCVGRPVMMTSANVDFHSSFSTVLLCRFYLNLRRVADKDDPVGSAASISSTTFSSRITGNMGEMLEFGSYLPDGLSLNSDSDAMERQTHDAVDIF